VLSALRGEPLARAIAAQPPHERDQFVDVLLGTGDAPSGDDPAVMKDPELIASIPSGVAAVADAILKARIGPDDVVVDVGSGAGRVALLVHLLTGAHAVGLEIQADLVDFARRRAAALRIDGGVHFVHGDAREGALPVGSVYYLYLPFVGRSMDRALERLAAVAQRQAIAVCALGVELRVPWLRTLDDSSLWLSVQESGAAEGEGPGRTRRPVPTLPSLAWVADERQRASSARMP